jgi:hypothetical protein
MICFFFPFKLSNTNNNKTYAHINICKHQKLSGADALTYITTYPNEFASSIADAAGVSVNIIKNVRVTNVTYVARRLEAAEEKEDVNEEEEEDEEVLVLGRSGRELLSTVDTVEVSFDMVTDLGAAGYTTSSEFVTVTSAALSAAVADNSLSTLIATTCGCTVVASTISYTLAASYPTLFPTSLPSPLPTYAPTLEMCSYDILTCGTSLVGNNFHRGNYVGYGSGEANYVILVEAVSFFFFFSSSTFC